MVDSDGEQDSLPDLTGLAAQASAGEGAGVGVPLSLTVGWYTEKCSAALLNAAVDASLPPEVLALCMLPKRHSKEVTAAHRARLYARHKAEGELAVRQFAVKRCDKRRAELLAMAPAERPFEPPPHRIFCEETGATGGLEGAHIDADAKAARTAAYRLRDVSLPHGGLGLGGLAKLLSHHWRPILMEEMLHMRVTSGTVNRSEARTGGDCMRRKHDEVLQLYAKYEAEVKARRRRSEHAIRSTRGAALAGAIS